MLVWLKFDEFIYRRETIHMPNDIKKKKMRQISILISDNDTKNK